MATYYKGLTIEHDASVPFLSIEGNEIEVFRSGQGFKTSDGVFAETLESLAEAIVNNSIEFKQRENARERHLKLLSKGVDRWNIWRKEYPEIRPILYDTNLTKEALGFDLSGINFSNADLRNATFTLTESREASKRRKLRGANFHEANLGGSKLRYADLTEANFCRADLYKTNLTGAILKKANLQGAQLAMTILNGARLDSCKVYGMSAWDLELEDTQQKNLVIWNRGQTKPTDSQIIVDGLEVAQFVYLLLENKNIRQVIDTVTSKVVLILGRFTEERKAILDAIHEILREKHALVPILFDFPRSPRREIIETVITLAGMSRFVVADITDAKVIIEELSTVVPNFPSVPVQPLILASQREYASFERWRKADNVLPEYSYKDELDLLDNLEEAIIIPVKDWEEASDKAAAKQLRMQETIREKDARIAALEAELAANR